ncbi:MAG: hypothetical protein ACP5OG_02090 [Candidatus Nanoarchaeia archaeon]
MKKRRFLASAIIIGIILIFIIIPQCKAAVVTELEIPNSPPYLVSAIPNFTWQKNTSLIEVFDLDDYFQDPNGDDISYSYSLVSNITLIINEASNNVSFIPDINFIGTVTVIFYASDGIFNVSSNVVYLNVGEDNEPPQWSSPAKSKSTIYQSDYVNFSAYWTDNFALKNYIFSINQNGYWINSSETLFSGVQNTSFERYQISAAAGTSVYWRFYAFDVSDNMNVTDSFLFNVSSMPVPPEVPSPSGETQETGGGGSGAIGELLSTIAASYTDQSKRIKNYTIEPEVIKVSLKQGDLRTVLVKVTNIGSYNLSFNVSIVGLTGFFLLSETNFELYPGKVKELTVDFIAKENAPPEQYFGYMVFSSSESRTVPIILDINAFDLKFSVDVNISQEYKTIRPGEKIRANITIKSLKDVKESKIQLYTALKDLQGNIYDSSQEELDITSSIALEKELSTTYEMPYGEYIFYARILNGKETAIDSDTFFIGSKFRFMAYLRQWFIFIIITFVSFFVLILMLKSKKDLEKERVLSLYILLNELKQLIEQGKMDQALELYIKIKLLYKEKVSKGMLEDKEKLKEEITKLAEELKKQKSPESKDKEIKEKNNESKEQTKEEANKDKESNNNTENKNNENKKEENKEENKEESNEKITKEESKDKEIKEKNNESKEQTKEKSKKANKDKDNQKEE